jgi:hypothetical protein
MTKLNIHILYFIFQINIQTIPNTFIVIMVIDMIIVIILISLH